MARSPAASGFRRTALAAGLLMLGALGLQLSPTTAATAAPRPARHVSAADVLVRGALWVGRQVPYSQRGYSPDVQGNPYRTDCSGFISMAWGLGRSLTTQTLPQVASALGPVGDYSGLQPGDMLDSTTAGHAVLFVRWADPVHTSAVIMEEAHPGTVARVVSGYYTTALLSAQKFVAYRYDGLSAPEVSATDWDQDGLPDVIARQGVDGTLWLFRGTRGGGLDRGRPIAVGWGQLKTIVEVGDFDGDGHPDLLTARKDGSLWTYSGDGHGGLRKPHRITLHWNPRDAVVTAGDLDGDGHADILARGVDGTLWLYSGDGSGGIGRPHRVDGRWSALTPVLSVADTNGDGHPDLLTSRGDGTVLLRAGNGKDSWGAPKPVTRTIQLADPGAAARIAAASTALGDADGRRLGSLLRLMRLESAPAAVLVSQHGQAGDVLVRRADRTLWISRADGHGGFHSPQRVPGPWARFDLVL